MTRLLDALNGVGLIDSQRKATLLEEALLDYRGEFLAGFQVRHAPRYEQWMASTREQIGHQVQMGYQKLGEFALTASDAAWGIRIAQRWLALDGLEEAAHALLIRLLLLQGDPSAANAHYRAYAERLRRELDVAPSPTLQALLKTETPQPSRAIELTPPRRHNLPAKQDQFFGRINAQVDIHSRLEQPWCRLVTLSGQGGIGKTRLAQTIAHDRVNRYRDGVGLVELATIDPNDEDVTEAIAVEVASALDLRLSGSARPAEQLLEALQQKEMLLLLDNFDWLLSGVPLINEIIRHCAGVQLLVTSRERLQLKAEWMITLQGLNHRSDPTDGPTSDAVEMFVARRDQHQRRPISSQELAAAEQICQMVGGVPLAIELAAAMTRDRSSVQIAAQLRSGLDSLVTTLRDVPARHSSLQTVFKMSWLTLTEPLQQRLARLSIFQGGFTAQAAAEIADATAAQLATLRDKSLLAYDSETDRYSLHEVVRAYAQRELAEEDGVAQRHAHYYLRLIADHGDTLHHTQSQQAQARIVPEMDNVRLAWQGSVARGDVVRLEGALAALSTVYQLRGLSHEGEAVMAETNSRASQWGTAGRRLAVHAALECARFQNRLGRFHSAITTVTAMLPTNDPWAEGMGHILWAEALWRQGQYDLAAQKLSHALEIAQAIGHDGLLGWYHHHSGIIHDIQARYELAHVHLQEACEIWARLGQSQTLSNSLNSLGLIAFHRGDLSSARQALARALDLCREMGNHHTESSLLNNLSIITTEQGAYLDAQRYLEQGLALATVSGNLSGQVELLTNLGRNYFLQGKNEAAIGVLERGLAIAQQLGNRATMANTLINLANAFADQSDRPKAERLYHQALDIAQQDQLPETECTILIRLAELLSKEEDQRSRQYSARAVTVAELLDSPRLIQRATAIHRYIHWAEPADEERRADY